MANAFKLTSKVGANALLQLLKNNMVWGKNVSTRYSSEFGNKAMQIGDTFTIRRPVEFITSNGATFVNQDVVTGSATVTIDKQRHIGITWEPTDGPLKVDALLNDSVLNGQMAQIAQLIESDIANEALEFPNWVGTPGQVVNSASDFLKAPERLDLEVVPTSDRIGILPPPDFYAIGGSFTTQTFYGNAINDKVLNNLKLPMISSVQPTMAQTVVSLTTGNRTAADSLGFLVAGASQSVNYADVKDGYTQTIDLDNFTAGDTIKRGEVFTISDVFAVNPRTKQVQTYLRQFVVLEDATADSTGAITLTIANPIIAATGADETLRTNQAYQTVGTVPANDAEVTFLGASQTTYQLPIVYHKDSIQLCYVKPTRPHNGDYSYATDPETGVTIRVWAFSSGTSDQHKVRVDVLYGLVNYDRRLGTKLSGTA